MLTQTGYDRIRVLCRFLHCFCLFFSANGNEPPIDVLRSHLYGGHSWELNTSISGFVLIGWNLQTHILSDPVWVSLLYSTTKVYIVSPKKSSRINHKFPRSDFWQSKVYRWFLINRTCPLCSHVLFNCQKSKLSF